jgi:hypothetical protein
MKRLIRGFDRLLRWSLGVFEFSAGPDCLLRVRQMALTHPVTVGGLTFPPGTPMVELHLWNEHIPPLPPNGPDLAWAVQLQRGLRASFRSLARQILQDARLAGAPIVGGFTVLPLAGAHAGGVKLFAQLGFTIQPYRSPLGRFGEFWENLYTWAIMWAFNAPTLAGRHLLRLRRSEVWMTTDELLRRYGEMTYEGGHPVWPRK